MTEKLDTTGFEDSEDKAFTCINQHLLISESINNNPDYLDELGETELKTILKDYPHILNGCEQIIESLTLSVEKVKIRCGNN